MASLLEHTLPNTLLLGMENGTNSLENNLAFSLKVKHTPIMCPTYSPQHLPKRNVSYVLAKTCK